MTVQNWTFRATKLSQQGKEKAAALLAVVLEETQRFTTESHGEEPV